MASNLFQEFLAPKLYLPKRSKLADSPTCPKCAWGGKDPDIGWRKYNWVNPEDATRFNVRDERGEPVGECLMVSCERCSYRWREPVKTPEPVEEPS